MADGWHFFAALVVLCGSQVLLALMVLRLSRQRTSNRFDVHWTARTAPPGSTLVIVPEKGMSREEREETEAALEQWRLKNPGAAAIVLAPGAGVAISGRAE